MAPNLERLTKVLTTLLIEYSEEEILEVLDGIPSHYKKVTRKNLMMMPSDRPDRFYMKVKGNEDDEPKPTKPERKPLHRSLAW